MRTKTITMTLVVMVTLLAACGNSKKEEKVNPLTEENWRMIGDRTVYGLACDGCNDSTLVLLPSDGSDPIRYSVIEATKQGRILGKPKIGDRVGVVPNEADSLKGDVVVDIDQLKGIWCYIVMPKLRDHVNATERQQERLVEAMSDSLRELYYIPREYGFSMTRNWVAQSVGYVRETTLESESPVVYPQLGYFTEWHLWNGYLVVTSGTPTLNEDKTTTVTDLVDDTCRIDYLQGDSLVLSSGGVTRSYYRKNSMDEVNQKAREIADKLRLQALEDTKQ
ncbi:MAG: hypothetical protein IJR71_06820 [Prevotella sp.]|nr:hypothetical protein [Prevotella sp.]